MARETMGQRKSSCISVEGKREKQHDKEQRECSCHEENREISGWPDFTF